MNPPVVFRPIVLADLDRLEEINAANVPEVGDVDRDRMTFLIDESSIAIAADVDGEVVGFCLVLPPGSTYDSLNYRWFAERHPEAMYLDRVAFDASVVGRGYGTALYGEVERIIARDHADADGLALEVNVDPPNEPSLGFHRKLGFVPVGRQRAKGIEVEMMHKSFS
ncbi:GNAT family N-acetyltransferase [Ilumatobacter nonamiensis]|uniref:GNAT family N-acetyltransferase n=1 Tax=Ilumatobacter nonamiensis TaxID=467093 RepID=UPI00034CFC80|nr:GNAT family N-acetyltransferase [Ilumatobacter nonamiensis]